MVSSINKFQDWEKDKGQELEAKTRLSWHSNQSLLWTLFELRIKWKLKINDDIYEIIINLIIDYIFNVPKVLLFSAL